jgi:hypothetical protein
MSGAVGAGLNGANSDGVFKSMVIGGVSAGLSHSIPVPSNAAGAIATRIGVGAGLGGAASAALGGSFKEGATQGALSSAVSMAYSDAAKSLRQRQNNQSKLDPKIERTFRDGKYRHIKLDSDVEVHRFWSEGIDPEGRYLTTKQTVAQINSPLEAGRILNLPEGNMATNKSTFIIPKGTDIYIGRIEGGGMKATQIYIKNPDVLFYRQDIEYK